MTILTCLLVQHASSFRATSKYVTRITSRQASKDYSIPDQPKRFANAKADKNTRFLDIDQFYKPGKFKSLNVLVTGG